jgi:DNA-binding GntR family transcriptional regulator
VTVVARVGAFVRSVRLRDVAEIYTVRAALECLAVQLCAENITTLGRAQLEDVIGEMRANVTANDPAAYVDALDRLHSIVMALADNRTLQVTHASLMGPVRRLRRIAMARGGRMRASFEHAVKIKDAISTGDKRVQDLMREQLRGACEAATAVLKEADG